jgi:hypothetical protein
MNGHPSIAVAQITAASPDLAGMNSALKEKWRRLFLTAHQNPFYQQIRSGELPDSDWARYSPQKVDDFLKTVLATFALLDDGEPFSTLETGVFAGGTSAVFLYALGLHFPNRSIHVGIDPYFIPEQSYPEFAETYGLTPYLASLKSLSDIGYSVRVPYLPSITSSTTFIRKDLLPGGYDFRLFHLDGDHTAEAVSAELDYFSSKTTKPSIFILDDLGDGFPEIDQALADFEKLHPEFSQLARFSYDTRAGKIGFGVFHLDFRP